MNDLYEALAQAPGSRVLRGPDGLAVQMNPSATKADQFNVTVFGPREEVLHCVLERLQELYACSTFLIPVRCADGMFVTMGRFVSSQRRADG